MKRFFFLLLNGDEATIQQDIIKNVKVLLLLFDLQYLLTVACDIFTVFVCGLMCRLF